MPILNIGQFPDGLNWGRDVDNSLLGSAGYYLSEPVRNYDIQQSGNTFTFRRWLSSQNNYNIYPYAISNAETGSLSTYISNPAFVLDTGEFLDIAGNFLFTWIYLKSTLTSTTSTSNNETLYYKSNATGLGALSKAALSANYFFVKPNIDQVVEIGDYLYMSFTDSNVGLVASTGFICQFPNWYGSFFRVTNNTVANQITLVEDNTIQPTLFPATNVNRFVKALPVANALVSTHAMLYDFGYCFRRPADTTNYLRPIAMTIDEDFTPNSFEYNGLIETLDAYKVGVVDSVTAANVTTAVISLNMPICRQVQFKTLSTFANIVSSTFNFSPLGSMDATAAPVATFLAQVINNTVAANPTAFTHLLFTRGFPVFRFIQIPSAVVNMTDLGIAPIACDYTCRI